MNVLQTERLALRRITTEDAETLVAILNEPAFVRFVADRGVRTKEQGEAYITEKMLPSFEKYGFGFFVVRLQETGAPIGMCGLIKRDGLDDVDIGFSFLREYWRHGYGYEAAAAVMDYGRREHGLSRIVGITSEDNEVSGKLLEKLGLRFERLIQVPGFTRSSRLFVPAVQD
ncbi:MAG: GNAT family N-acetyltransferase [Chthoniobacterales bacterium]